MSETDRLLHDIRCLTEIVGRLKDDVAQLKAKLSRVHGGDFGSDIDPRVAYDIVKSAASMYGVQPKDILGRKRHKVVVMARRAAIGAMKNEGASASAIARALNRDHSTILHHMAGMQ